MADAPKMMTELTDILDQDIETIVALRLTAERTVSSRRPSRRRRYGSLTRH